MITVIFLILSLQKKALGFVEGQTGSTEMGLDSSVKGSEMPKMRL